MNNSEYKSRNMQIWNEVAPRYHKRWARNLVGPFQSTAKLIDLVNIQPGSNVLDLACGTGVVTKKISEKIGSKGHVTGVDMSWTAINIAKFWNKKQSNIDFVNADAENFSFTKKFDFVTCQYALFFFPNSQKALKNVRKNLKNDGKIGIVVHGKKEKVPFFSSILDAITEFIPDYIPPGTPSLDRFGTKSSLKNEISKAGFEKISVKEFVFDYNPGTFDQYWKNYLKYVAKPLKEKLNELKRKQHVKLKEMIQQNTKPFTKKNGMVSFPWQVLILTANRG